MAGVLLGPGSREKWILPPGGLGRSDVSMGEVKVHDYGILCKSF